MEKDSLEIYEPLLWSMKDIEKCDTHNQKLEDKCQCCSKTIPYLHSKLQLGYCPYCQSWLGDTEKISSCELNKEEQFIYLNYKQLIQQCPKLNYFPSSNFLSIYLNKVKENSNIKSKVEFSEMLGITYVSLLRWMNNTFQPNRRNVLELMYKLNQTLYNAVCNFELFKLNISEIEANNLKKRVSKLAFKLRLLEAVENNEPKSLSIIAKENGYDAKYALRHFPEVSFKIQENYLDFMERNRIVKKVEVEKILKQALIRDVPISLTKLLEESNITARVARLYALELCKKVSARNKTYLSESKEKRLNNILERVRHAANELHQEEIFPSKDRINNKIGGSVFLEPEIRQGWTEIVEELGYDINRYKKNKP